MAEHTEPFAAYCNDRWNRPFLYRKTLRRIMHVQWGDGTLRHPEYHCFAETLDKEAMRAALMEIWKRYEPQLSRRAELSPDGVHGCAVYVPIDMGKEVYAVVLEHFNKALTTMSPFPCHPITYETACTYIEATTQKAIAARGNAS